MQLTVIGLAEECLEGPQFAYVAGDGLLGKCAHARRTTFITLSGNPSNSVIEDELTRDLIVVHWSEASRIAVCAVVIWAGGRCALV